MLLNNGERRHTNLGCQNENAIACLPLLDARKNLFYSGEAAFRTLYLIHPKATRAEITVMQARDSVVPK